VNRRYLRRKVLQGLRLIPLPKEEAYAADALAIGDIVLMSSGRTKAHKLVKDAGFDVLPIDTSEFEKCDGALTCLSILF
jgi:dimethylargininase